LAIPALFIPSPYQIPSDSSAALCSVVIGSDNLSLHSKPKNTMNNTLHKGPYPLMITKHDDAFVIISDHATHYATTYDPSAARLIAAAPDLLNALKALMQRSAKDAEHYAPDGNEPIWAFISDASDAIAKADGR
jgi:hypothetical protein